MNKTKTRLKLFYSIIFLFLVTVVLKSFASAPHIRKYDRYSDLKRGEADGVSITHLGELVLSPKLHKILDTGEPFIWCIDHDSQGNLYIGTGNDGRVYKITPKGDSTLFFDAAELEVYSLAIDKQDNVFIGTSPNGKVYRVNKNGESREWADPKDVYIWDLAIDANNNLYVATGNKGNVYRIDPKGQLETFFESEETHIRSLAIDNTGNLYAGSGDNGYVYLLKGKNNSFVLYDSPMREVHQIEINHNGTVFAAAMGDEGTQTPIIAEASVKKSGQTNQQANDSGNEDISLETQALSPANLLLPSLERSAIYMIDSYGSARDIWDSDNDRVQSFILKNDTSLYVGTGDKGKLYLLTTNSEQSMILDLDEIQISHLHKLPSGEINICTSNMGRLYNLGPALNEKGSYLSETFDTRVLAHWGTFSWETTGNKVLFYTRTGNTEEPGQTWSDWSEAYSNERSENISSPAARFLQWKCELFLSDNKSPVVDNILFSYLQQNLPPVITAVIIHSQGDYYSPNSNQTSSGSGSNAKNGIVFPQALGKAETKKGYQSIDWLFEDPNSDAIVFNLYYKQENTRYWTKLISDFAGNVYSWDSAQMQDGLYRIKLEASDSPSNPPHLIQTTAKISQPFLIDNTGPIVSNLKPEGSKQNLQVHFKVNDELSIIRMVEISVNAQGWEELYPVDGICDSKHENFTFSLPRQSDHYSIAIRATDDMDNTGFGTISFDK